MSPKIRDSFLAASLHTTHRGSDDPAPDYCYEYHIFKFFADFILAEKLTSLVFQHFKNAFKSTRGKAFKWNSSILKSFRKQLSSFSTSPECFRCLLRQSGSGFLGKWLFGTGSQAPQRKYAWWHTLHFGWLCVAGHFTKCGDHYEFIGASFLLGLVLSEAKQLTRASCLSQR